ncbi:DUF397 domain-containing protein [Streptomyces sp. NPDC006012]|uniref:DUF397 domain-containing protein n=1 Tax=Streptomyces sp. NPDC006012 TaxID=3364739 RepID=UPI0036A43D37
MNRDTRAHAIKATDIDGATWFKSTYSDNGTACVEVADTRRTHGRVAIKDSKQRSGPALLISPEAFAALVSDAAAGPYGL